MAKVTYSELAKSDLKDIYRYTYTTFGLDQADKYDSDIKSSGQTAAMFPRLGRDYTTQKGSEFKRYNSGRHVIFYVAEEGGIFIIRILHGRMDFDRHLD